MAGGIAAILIFQKFACIRHGLKLGFQEGTGRGQVAVAY